MKPRKALEGRKEGRTEGGDGVVGHQRGFIGAANLVTKRRRGREGETQKEREGERERDRKREREKERKREREREREEVDG
jgi:hypothetical protein